MELKIGFDGNDFAMNRQTVLAKENNLNVTFKISNNLSIINDDLFNRLIWFKAFRRIKICKKAYPLGGYLKFDL